LSSRKDKQESGEHKKVIGDHKLRAILESDPSVLSVSVLGREGGVSSIVRSAQLRKEEHADERTLQQLGTVGTVILGAATKAEGLFGGTEFILGAFKNGKILLVNLPEYDSALAVRLSRVASAESLYGKISEILARG
jgi:hypothetical protein